MSTVAKKPNKKTGLNEKQQLQYYRSSVDGRTDALQALMCVFFLASILSLHLLGSCCEKMLGGYGL